MKRGKLLLLIGSLLFLTPFASAQSSDEDYQHLLVPVKSYVVYQAKMPVVIDGKDDETDWQQAPWSDDFADIEGDKKSKPFYRTHLKMLYDDSNLYILAELEEPDIWATYATQDMIIYRENDLEVFIDPDQDTHNYFEYELNALNTLLDLRMPLPYRNGGLADIPWKSKAFQSAVSVDGTLNDPRDKDKKWTVEMKIPFADLEVQKPYDHQIWKVNFSRVEWQTRVVDGKYQKMKDPQTGRAYPEYNWVWSPPGLINMHYPERWGMIQFSGVKIGSQTVDFKMPENQPIVQYLWLVYYKQKDFKRKNSRYANSLEELEMPQAPKEVDAVTPEINMMATGLRFTVQIILKDGSALSIDDTGLFITNKK